MSTRAVFKYGLASLVPRVAAILGALLLMPLTITSLGVSGYAIWLLATQIPSLVVSPDLGLGQSLVNRLASTYRNTGSLQSNTQEIAGVRKLLSAIMLGWFALGTTFGLLYSWLGTETYQYQTFFALAIALLCFLSAIPASIWPRVQLAQERAHLSLYAEGAGRVVSLLASVLVLTMYPNLYLLIVVTLLPTTVASWLNALFEERRTFGHRISTDDGYRAAANRHRDLMRVGRLFLVMQVAFLLGTGLDPYVLQYFGSHEFVTQWSVEKRPFDMMPLAVALYSTALWPLFARMRHSKDRQGLLKVISWAAGSSLLLCALAAAMVVAIREPLYSYLSAGTHVIHSGSIVPLTLLAFGTCLSMTLTNLLNAFDEIRSQALFSVASGVAMLIAKCVAAQAGDLPTYFYTAALTYLVFWILPLSVISTRQLARLKAV